MDQKTEKAEKKSSDGARGGDGNRNRNRNRNRRNNSRRRKPGQGPKNNAEGQEAKSQSPRSEGGQRRQSSDEKTSNSQTSARRRPQRKQAGSGNSKNSGQNRDRNKRGKSPNSRRRRNNRPGQNKSKAFKVNLEHLTQEEKLHLKYFQMVQEHVKERQSFYDRFGRCDNRTRTRLERKFFNSIEKLRAWEDSLSEAEKGQLDRFVDFYRYDSTYSDNRSIDAAGTVEVQESEIQDPHFLESQKKALQDYQEDTEESSGSYEDYLKYKGL